MAARKKKHEPEAVQPMLFESAGHSEPEPRSEIAKAKTTSRRSRALATFYKERKAHSAIKTEIVMKYFPAWLRIIGPRNRSKKIGYIDLFAGPGKYDDGTESTPLRIMRHILADPALRQSVMTLFTEKKASYFKALRHNISELPGIESLKYAPQILRQSAGESDISEYFDNRSIIPTFMFLDPFGYSGLSLKLIRAVLKDWGCEVIFFWNFNRINAARKNNKVRAAMDAIFGTSRVERLRLELAGHHSEIERERIILGTLREALDEAQGRYMEYFRFRNTSGNSTHHLVFVTKHELGQRIMKDIMAGQSSYCDSDGVASFEYNPAPNALPAPSLFGDSAPTAMQCLKDDLLARFSGQALTVEEIYRQHNYGTRYVLKNYQEALRRLYYDEGKVSLGKGHMPMSPAALKRRAMSGKYVVIFDKV